MNHQQSKSAGASSARRKYTMRTYPRMRMFESDFLEAFSTFHISGPALLWIPVVSWLLWRSVMGRAVHGLEWAGLGLAGLFTWTFMEYVLHRFLFHTKFPGKWGERLHFMIHGVHHVQPDDPGRLVMPGAPAIMIALPLYFAFRLVLGEQRIDVFFAFFLLGYLAYDYTHYYLHHFTPKSAWGRYLKKSHMLHHYAAEEVRWGVSSPFWDLVFGTYHLPKKARGHRLDSFAEGAGESEPVPVG